MADQHFGGGVLKKSDDEKSFQTYQEMIANFKRAKMERKQEKEETMELTEQVDEMWKEMNMQGLTALGSKKRNREPVQKADDYDMTVNMLKFESRGQVSVTCYVIYNIMINLLLLFAAVTAYVTV